MNTLVFNSNNAVYFMVALEQADLMERVLMELALACLQCDLYSARSELGLATPSHGLGGTDFLAFVRPLCTVPHSSLSNSARNTHHAYGRTLFRNILPSLEYSIHSHRQSNNKFIQKNLQHHFLFRVYSKLLRQSAAALDLIL
ncbi:hypothetical protein MRB53_007362 [Persea americana]|uniref:Uncharacterized protein n=1 Tax=Persea americana TaxID=3435 RepID=A0ACC2MJV1_PERAE|nr:hypothetical protein MRB53_007362 [Persea americana]